MPSSSLVLRVVVGIVVAVLAVGVQAQYFTTDSDLRRSELFEQCQERYPGLKEMVLSPQGSLQSEANMDNCNKLCGAENSSNRQRYLDCYSCCDTYYGQTPRDRVEGTPVIPALRVGTWAVGSYQGTRCQTINFPAPYPPGTQNRIHVQVSLAHSSAVRNAGSTYSAHDPSTVWMESITNTGFTVCLSETEQTGDNLAHDPTEVINWLVSTDDSDYVGVMGSYETPAPFNQAFCNRIAYGRNEGENQAVLVSMSHRFRANGVHDPTTSWIKDISVNSILACTREVKINDDSHDYMVFDYMTFPPQLTCPGYIETGTTEGSRLQVLTTGGPTNCLNVPFRVAFPTKPLVFTTLVSPIEGVHWVESVFTDAFIVCARDNRGGALDWNKLYFIYYAQTETATERDCYESQTVKHAV